MNGCSSDLPRGASNEVPFVHYFEVQSMKPFTNIDEQIELLKSRNLTFLNESLARQSLTNYGYYEIVNGYKYFTIELDSEEEIYKDGETFEHMLALYELDKDIRKGIIEATMEIELSLRTAIGYVVAKDIGVEKEQYLDRRNYNQGKKNKRGYEIDQLIHKLNKIYDDNSEPYKHYRETHGHIPPWILLKGTTLGNLVTMCKLLKPAQKEQVISTCLTIPKEFITEEVKATFSEILYLVLAFRNRSAHSGRLFNYHSEKYSISCREFFHKRMGISEAGYRKGAGKNDLYTLFNSLTWFKNEDAAFHAEFALFYSLKEHLKKFPDDDVMFTIESGMPLEYIKDKIVKYSE